MTIIFLKYYIVSLNVAIIGYYIKGTPCMYVIVEALCSLWKYFFFSQSYCLIIFFWVLFLFSFLRNFIYFVSLWLTALLIFLMAKHYSMIPK